jgi:6-phosphogluconolactonase (cycloisomerase 2 family)
MLTDGVQGQTPKALPGKTSRRRFLQRAAGLATTASLSGRAAYQPPDTALPQAERVSSGRTQQGNVNSARSKRTILAYVGTYSSPQGPEGSLGRGEGVYLFQMNPSTGALLQREVFLDDSNPAWLAYDPSRTHLYSANETQTYQGANSGSVSAFTIQPASGHLTLLNTVSSEGAGPAHLSVHPSGKYVLVANYAGGTVAVLPIRPNGELGPASDVKQDEGAVGPTHATSAPPGSFAISGHDRPHAHMIQADAAGRFVLASDLGLDRIFVWEFDVKKGTLSPNDPAWVPLPPGDGPRHFAFHPNGHWLYSLQEEGSTLAAFDYDAVKGRLTPKQTLSSLPKGFAGTNFTSEVMVSADGKFVYAANRLHDSIAFFSISDAGTLTLVGEEWTRGDYPRSFNIDPTGNFLYSCNQRSDAITAFRIDRKTGGLKFTGSYTPVGTPAIIIFL